MENEFDGTLFFKGEGKKRRLYLNFTTRNNKTWENPIGENLLSDSLKQFAREEKGDGKKSVKLQEQGGRPVAVYLEGETEINKKEETQADYSKKDSAPNSDKSKYPYQKEFKSDKSKGESINIKHEFHNPYNFVPAIPRDVSHAELGDKNPVGHDRFHEGYYSGKLTVKMTVETPLVVLDTAKVEMQGEHKKFPVRIENGKPFINPTAVKGMLRSAYEAVTNSRMSVFTKHEERLAFRREAKSPIPVRIEENDGKFFAKPLEYQKIDNRVMNGVAKLPRYAKNSRDIDKGESRNALRYISGELPKHGDAVFVKYRKIKAGAEVQEIKKRQENEISNGDWIAGWVCITGANISGKRFERVFLDMPNSQTIPVEKRLWEELIKNYQEIHKKEIEKREKENKKPSDYLGDKPGQTAWSRHIYEINDLTLKHGTLCYAEIEDGVISSIFPVMISRQLFESSPDDLLDDSLKPCSLIEDTFNNDKTIKDKSEMSPADRVFGYVIQKRKNNSIKGIVAGYKGQLRISAVRCLTEKSKAVQEFDDLPLNILGQPKPQQGRFYVAKNKGGDAQVDGLNNENAGYNLPLVKGLRGRKVYPHHAHIKDDKFWFSDSNFSQNGNDWKVEFRSDGSKVYYREYLRPKNNNQQQRDSQNRSIQGWIKPNTEFEFDIHFTNLSKVELGALIWLLSLNGGNENKYFHRFGGGKPYGFGSVRLEVVSEEITSGEDLKTFYQTLDAVPEKSISSADCKTEFEKVANQGILQAFKVACKGFDDGLPIHYPRTSKSPNPEGKSFEWFVDNSSKSGFKLPLQNLSDEIGLPLKPKS